MLQRCQCLSRLSLIWRPVATVAPGWLITTTSRPASNACCWRNDSRIIRLMRFLPVALRQCFLEIARPSLAMLCLLRLHNTVKYSSRLRVARSNTRPKAAASSSRCCLVNRLPWLLINPELLLVVATDVQWVTVSTVRGPWRDGASRRDALLLSPCGHENRACARA